jgi:hypothetical protein
MIKVYVDGGGRVRGEWSLKEKEIKRALKVSFICWFNKQSTCFSRYLPGSATHLMGSAPPKPSIVGILRIENIFHRGLFSFSWERRVDNMITIFNICKYICIRILIEALEIREQMLRNVGTLLIYLAVLVWIQGFTLTRQVLYHWSHTPIPSCFSYCFG